MKNLFRTIILGMAFAGVAFAQTSSKETPGNAAEVKMAVVEFSPAADFAGMTPEAKRQIQAAMAAALEKTRKFDIADVRWTRNESQDNLAALNGGGSTAAAVRLGKKLGVRYVLTGSVEEYTIKGADGFGSLILKTRLIDVATGKVVHAVETTQRSTSKMSTTGVAEMQAKTVMPAIKKLAAMIAELKL
jgi:TolB-like protein